MKARPLVALLVGVAGCGPAASPTAPAGVPSGVSGDGSQVQVPEKPPGEGTAPVITELCWDVAGPSGGYCGDRPLPDDPTSYRCAVRDDDGDALTVRLTFRAIGGCETDRHCWTESRTFAAHPPAEIVYFEASRAYPRTPIVGAVLTCDATDARGLAADPASVCFGTC